MKDINSVIVSGVVSRDAEIKTYKARNGKDISHVEFHLLIINSFEYNGKKQSIEHTVLVKYKNQDLTQSVLKHIRVGKKLVLQGIMGGNVTPKGDTVFCHLEISKLGAMKSIESQTKTAPAPEPVESLESDDVPF